LAILQRHIDQYGIVRCGVLHFQTCAKISAARSSGSTNRQWLSTNTRISPLVCRSAAWMEVTMRFFSDAEKNSFRRKKEYSMQEILCVQKSCRRMPAAMNHFLFDIKLDIGCILSARIRFVIWLFVVAEHACENVVRECLYLQVVGIDGAVEIPAGNIDTVLRAFDIRLKILELCWVVFRSG